jgi:hypothetical protein
MITTDVHVFVGPSDPDPALLTGLHRHPLITRGDLGALLESTPQLVMIIDGEFGQSLAVTVTEIRALLGAGTQVWGVSRGILEQAEAGIIRALASSVPWYERDEKALNQAAGQRDLRLVERFLRFAGSLPPGVGDRKRRDAELMLAASRTVNRMGVT